MSSLTRKARLLLIPIIILSLLISSPSALGLTESRTVAVHSVIPAVSVVPAAAVRNIWLTGSAFDASPGWNHTTPGPFIPVVSGDTINLMLINGDSSAAVTHNWFIDFNDNLAVDASETSTSSPNFSSTTTYSTFTFSPVVGTNVPAAGSYHYRCRFHPTIMFGTISVADFSISASAANPASFVAGSSATSTITLTSVNSFAGSVNLAASTTLPVTGLTFSFSMTPVTLTAGGTGTSTLTISTTTSTPAGTYAITVTGTGNGGSPSHTATTAVTVVGPDFSISSSPTSLSIVQGSSGTSTVALTGLNGFIGIVTLGVAVSPMGPTASINPSSVSLSSGAGTAMLTVSTSAGAYSSTATGTYTITITGTSGSLSHPATVSVTVTSPSSSPLGVGNIPVSVLIGVIAAAVAVIVVAVILVRRRPKT